MLTFPFPIHILLHMDNFVVTSLNVDGHTEEMDFEKTDQWHKLLELTYAAWRVADSAIGNEFLKNKVKQTAAEILVEYPNALGDRKKMEELFSRIRSQRALLSLAQKTSNSRELNFTILKNEYHKIGTVVTQLMPPASSAEQHHHAPKKETPVLSEAERSYKMQSSEAEGRVAASISRDTLIPTLDVKVSHRQAHTESVKEAELRKQQEKEAGNTGGALTERQKKIFQFFSKRKGEKIRLKEIAQVFPDLTDRTVRNDLRDLCTKKCIMRSDGHGQASFYKLV